MKFLSTISKKITVIYENFKDAEEFKKIKLDNH